MQSTPLHHAAQYFTKRLAHIHKCPKLLAESVGVVDKAFAVYDERKEGYACHSHKPEGVANYLSGHRNAARTPLRTPCRSII